MITLDESIARAMDGGGNVSIVPFLPYILQDFWEIGTPSGVVTALVRKHCAGHSTLNVLDLGCGKGAVSVKLAEAFQCNCYGIDGIPDFIETSKEKAREYGVNALCRFETGDIREKINDLDLFDVIILGAVGPVFGNYYETLTTLSEHLAAGGIVLINDAYIDDASSFRHPSVLPRREIIKQINQAGMELIDETTEDTNAYADEFRNLKRRCRELAVKHSAKAGLFENFIKAQADEYDALQHKLVGAIMIVKSAAREVV